jgi:hypothetical protein
MKARRASFSIILATEPFQALTVERVKFDILAVMTSPPRRLLHRNAFCIDDTPVFIYSTPNNIIQRT